MTVKFSIADKITAREQAPRHAVGTPPRHRLATSAVWGGPALATLLITSFRADQAELWRDELATWSAATRSLSDLLRLLGSIDAVFGPYYLFMHVWIAVIGDSVLALRAPAILAMTGAAAVTAQLGARLFGPRAGVLGGLLFAVTPVASRYAQEARSYAFTMLLAVTATLLLDRALRRTTWPRWLAYGTAIIGLGLAHLVAVSLVAGHAAAVVGRRDARRRWLVTVIAAGCALTPLALVAAGQRATQLAWVEQADLGHLATLPNGVFQSGVVGGAIVALAVLGWAGHGGWLWTLALSALAPAVLLFLAGVATELFVPRYLVFIAPLVCLLAGVALARIRWPAAVAAILLVAFLGGPAQSGLRRTHEWPRSEPRAYSRAAEIIRAGQRPGDGIVYGSRTDHAFLDTAIAYHLRDTQPRDVLLVRSAAQRGSFWATECAHPARCLAGTPRVWLLTVGQRPDPLRGMASARAEPLRREFAVEQVWHVPGLTVALLVRR